MFADYNPLYETVSHKYEIFRRKFVPEFFFDFHTLQAKKSSIPIEINKQ